MVDLNSRFPLIPPPPSRLQLPGLKSNEVRVMLTGALVHSPADLIHHLWPSLHNNSVDIVKSLRCLICVTDSPRPSCVSARTHIFSPPPPVCRTLTNQPNCLTLVFSCMMEHKTGGSSVYTWPALPTARRVRPGNELHNYVAML